MNDSFITKMVADIHHKLSGGVITQPIIDESGEYFGFIVEKDGKSLTCFVNQDPEGNGPGFLSIEPMTNAL